MNNSFIIALINWTAIQFCLVRTYRAYFVYRFTRTRIESYAISLFTLNDKSMMKFMIHFKRNFWSMKMLCNCSKNLCLIILIHDMRNMRLHIFSRFDLLQINNIFVSIIRAFFWHRNDSHENHHDFV
jgi:hypothetical protein